MRQSNQLAGPRLILGFSLLLGGVAIYQLAVELSERTLLFVSLRWTGILFLAAIGLFCLGVLFGLTWSNTWTCLADRGDQVVHWLSKLGAFNLLLFGLVLAGFAYLVLGPLGIFLKDISVRIGLFWFSVLLGALFIKAYRPKTSMGTQLVVSALMLGFGYRMIVFIPDISTHPFTLAWSEASRYYYASLYFAERIYDQEVQLTPLHPSRYLMQAVPFLVQDLPIWFHRLWQVFLWIGMSLLTVYLLGRRLKLASGLNSEFLGRDWPSLDVRIKLFLFIAWGILFLFQGPVYYHLLIIPALLVWWLPARRSWLTWLLVLLVSVWAGISRINWFPMPGMIAAVLYFLETSIPAEHGNSELNKYGRYLIQPIGWICLGTASAFLSQFLFLSWAGIEQEALTSSFTSDLLWYRLLPSPTYPLGILPAILIVSIPLLWIMMKGLKGIHPVRAIGLGVILFLLFIGGVIVSTKIGGGSNLHNLDAFLVILLIAGSYALFGAAERDSESHIGLQTVPGVILTALVLLPVFFAVQTGSYNPQPSEQDTQQVLAQIKSMVEEAVNAGGEVLFISDRQLLTFEDIPGVPLVDKYEKVYLMEMAMAGNQSYLNEYYRDIDQQRFALIITDPMKDVLKGKQSSFGEENDVWVKRVVRPTFSQYERRKLFKEFAIEVLEPIP